MQISNIHFTSVSRIMQTGRYQNVRPFWIIMIEVVAVTTENAPRFNTFSLWRGSDLSTPKYSNKQSKLEKFIDAQRQLRK